MNRESKRMNRLMVSALLCPAFAAVAAAASTPTLFLNGGGSTVSIFGRNTLTEEAYVASPGLNRSIALSPDGRKAYVATGHVLAVDTVTHKIAAQFLSHDAVFLRLSPDGSRLYAANADGSVWVYDAAAGTVVSRIPFSVKHASLYSVTDLTVSSDGKFVVLGSIESNCEDSECPPNDPAAIVSEIDGQTNSVLRRIPVSNVSSLAISGDSSSIYVASQSFVANQSAILKLNTLTGQVTDTIHFAASKLALDSTAGRLYAGTSSAPFTLGVFSTADDSSLAQIALTAPVTALSFTSDHATIFAGGCVTNNNRVPTSCPLTAIASGTWQTQPPGSMFGKPVDFAVSPDNNSLWIAGGSPVQLTAVDTAANQVSGGAEVDNEFFSMVVTPNGNKVYTSNLDNTISVIDGHSLARLKVLGKAQFNGGAVGDHSVSPDGKRAYISQGGLQVVDTRSDTIVGTIQEFPEGSAVSPDSQILYTFKTVIDPNTNLLRLVVTSYSATTLAPILSSSFPNGLASSRLFVSPDGITLYLVAGNATLVIDAATLNLQRTISQLCADAALSPEGHTLYCLREVVDTIEPDEILALSAASGEVTRTYATGARGLGHLALLPDGSKLYLSTTTHNAKIPGVLEQIDVATGAVQLANTSLVGKLAIQ